MKTHITVSGNDFNRTYFLTEKTGNIKTEVKEGIELNSAYHAQIMEVYPTAKVSEPYKAWHGGLLVDITVEMNERRVIATSSTNYGITQKQKTYEKK
jgi:hypothetical protein